MRSAPEGRQQVGDGVGRASDLNLHRAIHEIANRPPQTEARRLASRPPAKTYTLHPSFDDDSNAHFGDIWLH